MRFLPKSEALEVASHLRVHAQIDLDVAKEQGAREVARAFRERYNHDVPPAWLHQAVERIEAEDVIEIRTLAIPPPEGTSVIVAGGVREFAGPVRDTHRLTTRVQDRWSETGWSAKIASHAGWDLDTGLMVFELEQ